MSDRLLADAVVALHLAFILFVVGGGLLVARWRCLAWLHLPALAWGALVEWAGWICPLTPLENALRFRAGLAGYSGGFVEEYLIPVVYPPHLTRVIQVSLGAAAVVINVLIYAWLWRSRSRPGVGAREEASSPGGPAPTQGSRERKKGAPPGRPEV